MSAESEISSLLSYATSSAASLSDWSSTMVDKAIETLQKPITFPHIPDFTPSEAGYSLGGGHYSQAPAAGFPAWPEIQLEAAPSLQELAAITLNFNREFPALSLPTFSYAPVGNGPGALTATLPEIAASMTMPALPDTELAPASPLLSMTPLSAPTLTLTQPALAAITPTLEFDPALFETAFAQFRSEIFGGTAGIPGLDAQLAEFKTWSDHALSCLLPLVMAELRKRLGNQYAPVLAFHADLQERLEQRLAANHTLLMTAITDRSGWGLPKTTQQAIYATAQQNSAAWRAHAQSQVETKTAELALDYFQFCGSLFQSFSQGVQALKAKELELIITTHQHAIAYAKQITGALFALFEARYFTQYDAAFQKDEAQLRGFEGNMKLAAARFEIANGKLEIEQGNQESDENRLAEFQAEAKQAALDERLFASEVSAARDELELKKASIELFELQTRAFDRRMDAYYAEIKARIADIEADSSLVDAELRKAKTYELEADAFEEIIAAKQRVVTAQSSRNEDVIAEYQALVKAELTRVRKTILKDEVDLATYQLATQEYLADLTIALQKSQTDLNFSQKEQAGMDEAYRLSKEIGQILLEMELSRLEAISTVDIHGAGILANMAESASSIATGIAAVLVEE